MEIEGVSLVAFIENLPAVIMIGGLNNIAVKSTLLAFISNDFKLLSSRNELFNTGNFRGPFNDRWLL